MLGFFPGDALPGLYCSYFSVVLVSVLPSGSETHVQLDPDYIIDLAMKEHSTSLA